MWIKKKLLVVAKTYPEFSKSHRETVCTAAIDADTGQLVRVYPLSLRYMDRAPNVFEWVEADVKKNPRDPRPESLRVRGDSLRIIGEVRTDHGWRERSAWVLKECNRFKSVETLRAANKERGTSLAFVKPALIEDVFAVRKTEADHAAWEEKRAAALAQQELLGGDEAEVRALEFPWVEYRVKFRCDDSSCAGHNMSVHDWGMYVLDRKMCKQEGDIAEAERKVLAKLNELLDSAKKDSWLLLGNSLAGPSAFFIGGLYYPPRQVQAGFDFLQVADPAAIGRPQKQVREHRSVAARRVGFEAE